MGNLCGTVNDFAHLPDDGMALDQKIKTALDETRLLVLGSAILLGFQFHVVFEEEFHGEPSLARVLDGVAIVLMVLANALLVTPSLTHRIAERGRIGPRIYRITTSMTALALAPFAVGLGLDGYIVVQRLYGAAAGALAGTAFTLAALWFWYGLQMIRRPRFSEIDMGEEQSRIPPLPERIDQLLTEARVMLPGVQALLGFQLVIAFTRTFADMPAASKGVHAAALGALALTMILLMAPAAYHRLVHNGRDTLDTLRVGHRLLTSSTAPLAFAISADVYVALERIARSVPIAAAGALFALFVVCGLWYVFPLLMRAPARAANDAAAEKAAPRSRARRG